MLAFVAHFVPHLPECARPGHSKLQQLSGWAVFQAVFVQFQFPTKWEDKVRDKVTLRSLALD